jgi:hypothetical protein
MPTKRSALSLVAASNGKIYAIGGQNPGRLSTVEEYDPATNTWATRPSMPVSQANFGAASANGKIYAICGRQINNLVYAFTPPFELNNPYNTGWVNSEYKLDFDVTSLAPRGIYTVAISGAFGADGLKIAPNSTYTFNVDYYIISGNAGVAGATLSYTDGTSKTVTADGSGNYSFAVSYNWSGTVTPSKPGYTFTPANMPYTNVLANQTAQDYTAIPICYTLTLGHSGQGSTPTATPTNSTSCPTGKYISSESISLSGATPATNWQISGWTGTTNNSSTASTNVLTMPASDHTVNVIYVDVIAPTVSMSSSTTNSTNSSPIPVTVTFSEGVTGFIVDDIVASNGTVSNFAGSGANYTFDITPAGQGLVTADIAADIAQDYADNNNAAAAQFSRTYDSIVPTVTISSLASDPTKVSPIAVTVTFSENVTGFTSTDIVLSNGMINNFAGSGASYTFNLTPAGQGLVTANIAGGAAIDSAGNGNTIAAQFSRTYDSVAPFVTTITRVNSSPTNLASVSFTVTFSEPVTGIETTEPFSNFALTTSNISGAAISGVSGSGNVYTVTVSTGSINNKVNSGSIRLDMPASTVIADLIENQIVDLPFTHGAIYTVTTFKSFNSAALNDGWTLESRELSNAANQKVATGTLRVGDDANKKQYRSILHFDTASLPDKAVITTATLNIKKAGISGAPFATLGDLLADIKKGYFGLAALELGDFNALGMPNGAVGKFTATSDPSWYRLGLSPLNFQYVNLTGVTQFRLRFAKDDDNDKIADVIAFYAGDAALADRPQLLIEYYVP